MRTLWSSGSRARETLFRNATKAATWIREACRQACLHTLQEGLLYMGFQLHPQPEDSPQASVHVRLQQAPQLEEGQDPGSSPTSFRRRLKISNSTLMLLE